MSGRTPRRVAAGPEPRIASNASQRPVATALVALVGCCIAGLTWLHAWEWFQRPDLSRARAQLRYPVVTVAEQARSATVANTLISHVEVDKTRLCIGEDALIEVWPRDGAEITEVVIDRVKANPVVTRFATPGLHRPRISVYGRDSETGRPLSETRRLVFTVADCPDHPMLTLSKAAGVVPKQLTARVARAQGLGAGVTYTWDFGDGTVTTSTEPSAGHVYDIRDASDEVRTYLITVSAEDAEGRSAVARMHYQLRTDALANTTSEERDAAMRAALPVETQAAKHVVRPIPAPEETQIPPTPLTSD